MKTLRTLFSGGCLFDLGAQQAGYRHLDGYELEPKIAAVARLNGFDVRVADVCSVDYATLPAADHLHASPSCKNASAANQPGLDADGEKLPRETAQDLACADAVARAIAAHQGDTFTLENVWGYRTFESFDRIRAALTSARFSYEYWHLNAADYGVPQTRKRLILIARRGLCRIQRPHPTHRQGGDMFHPPWVGWYRAIEDIIDTLPPTAPARWQLARLPKEIRESMLLQGARSPDGDNLVKRFGNEPSPTVVSAEGGRIVTRAYVVSNAKTEYGDGVRKDDEPMLSVTTQMAGRTRAYLVQSKNTGQQWGDGTRDEVEPAFSIVTDHKPSHLPKAYPLDGDNARADTGEPTLRHADEPAMTMRGTRTPAHRAAIAGRWVRMTVQALGRFQTVPDDYRGLTPEINGNGVPCLLARRIMESMHGK